MNKEDVLAKSRAENKGMDERQKSEQLKANTTASFASIILTLLLMIISLVKGVPFYPFSAIIFCNLAVLNFLNYRIDKNIAYKISYIAWALAAIINVIMFIWKG